MRDYLALDAKTVSQHIDALLTEYPELAEDEALRADMIEGETALASVVSRALSHKLEARGMVKMAGERKSDLNERQARWQRREDAMDLLIKGLLEVAGLEKLVLAEATVSIIKPRASVLITDEAEIPQGYVKTIRHPDKTAIGDALKAGEEIPGAALSWGEPSLSVRTR